MQNRCLASIFAQVHSFVALTVIVFINHFCLIIVVLICISFVHMVHMYVRIINLYVITIVVCSFPTEGCKVCIRKFGNNSYVGMGQVQNGVLYLRYRNDSTITKAERCKAFKHKMLLLMYCTECFQASANHSQSQENPLQKKYLYCYSSSLFFIMHNLKTIGCIRMFYISNICSTIKDLPFQVQSCIRPMIGVLRLQTRTAIFLLCHYV